MFPACCTALLALLLLAHGVLAAEPLVIGQSLPLSGSGYTGASRVRAGAEAHVARINASGGVQGRPLDLLSLDDGGSPQQHAANLRTLVQQHKAVMLVNCIGEASCLAAATVAHALQVRLVGAMSGAAALRTREQREVFTLRPDDAAESAALVRQLQSLGLSRIALLADAAEPARLQALVNAAQRAGLQLSRFDTEPRADALAAQLQLISRSGPQALLLHLSADSVEALAQQPPVLDNGFPGTIAALSSAGLSQLARLFKGRVLGYTSVVPNPELDTLQITRELQRDADAHGGMLAASFEGLESYLALRLCTEVLRRAGTRTEGPRLIEALENLHALDLGGFRLAFSRERHEGSGFIEIGLRSRDGRLMR